MKQILLAIIISFAGGLLFSQEFKGFDKILAGERVNWALISAAGTSFAGNNYSIEGSFGQPVIGVSAGNKFSASHGFWYYGMDFMLSAKDESPTNMGGFKFQSFVENGVLKLSGDFNGSYVIDIINLNGITLIKNTVETEPGIQNIISVDVSDLSSGIYFVKCSSGNSISTSWFTVVN